MERLTIEQIDAITAMLERASTGPWRTNTADKTGEDWLIASLGHDEATNADIILTTDGVRGSDYDGDGALADAALIVALRNAAPALLAAARAFIAEAKDTKT